MIESPEHLLTDFSQAGASHLTVHVETCPNLHRTLQMIRELGCKAGVTLNPGTPATLIEPVLHLADLVLVMSVNPGYSGQTFLPEVLPKVMQIRRKLDEVNPKAVVEIDGGITPTTLPLALRAGAQVFVTAYSVFKNPDGIAAGIRELREAMTG
jgi:ribulose-phosphate 3-epimerase